MTDLNHSKLFLEIIPRTMRMVRMEIRRIAGDEFTTPQYRLLAKISKNSWSNQELAEWMGVSPPTMSKMVDKLVERGLVSRNGTRKSLSRQATGDAEPDRRKIAIHATARGIERTSQVRAAVQRIFARRIARLPAGRKRDLLAGLTVLKELFS